MKPKQIEIIFAVLAVLLFAGASARAQIFINDGQNHIFSAPVADPYVDIVGPGTTAQIVDGAELWYIGAGNYAAIQVDGGLIWAYMNAVNGTIIINGGTVGSLNAYHEGLIEINGGTIEDIDGEPMSTGAITVYDTGTIINIRGGNILGSLVTNYYGTIYLYGNNFSIGAQQLNFGDNLRDFGVLNEVGTLTGTVSGTLADGSSLSVPFYINDATGGDIIVVPEPATLLLLSAGFAASRFLRSRRH